MFILFAVTVQNPEEFNVQETDSGDRESASSQTKRATLKSEMQPSSNPLPEVTKKADMSKSNSSDPGTMSECQNSNAATSCSISENPEKSLDGVHPEYHTNVGIPILVATTPDDPGFRNATVTWVEHHAHQELDGANVAARCDLQATVSSGSPSSHNSSFEVVSKGSVNLIEMAKTHDESMEDVDARECEQIEAQLSVLCTVDDAHEENNESGKELIQNVVHDSGNGRTDCNDCEVAIELAQLILKVVEKREANVPSAFNSMHCSYVTSGRHKQFLCVEDLEPGMFNASTTRQDSTIYHQVLSKVS